MCGRFVSTAPAEEIARYFDAEPPAGASLEPAYNVAPTDDVYAVLQAGGVRRVETFQWGLVPFWAKARSGGAKMINARAETLASKFRREYENKRCIVPADGFYEWAKVPGYKQKQPMYIRREDGEPLAMAGLWEVWRNPDDREDTLHSCTVVTGSPNELIAKIHDRMPVLLPPDAWATWLDPDLHDLDVLGELLVPAPESLLTLQPVSTEVNNVRHQGPALAAPAAPIIDLEPIGLGYLGQPEPGPQGTLL